MDNGFIAKLTDLSRQDACEYGAKAAMLGELTSWGISVPFGYAVSVRYFDVYLQNNCFSYKPDDFPSYSTEIRDSVYAYDFDPEFLDSLRACVTSINEMYPGDDIIVRSSALCEDSQVSSMAGIFYSSLGLKTFDDIVEAIKRCYQSLFSDSVMSRYAEGRINASVLKTGIILQRYIRGEVSGVMFTADAVDMSVDKIVISAVNGVCSGITSGSEYATTYTCDKNTLLVQSVVGEQCILSKHKLEELLKFARLIEANAGYYQDIEWTCDGDKLYFLQTRPISGIKDMRLVDGWRVECEKYRSNRWTLESDICYPPLLGELEMECGNSAGCGAYDYGMDWDSVVYTVINGYLYKSKRDIPNSKVRLDAFFSRINSQFDCGEDEFDKNIKPELLQLISDMHFKYIYRVLCNEELIQYITDAHYYMRRASALHWRATTSEWYLGHFFRNRVERLYEYVSAQDLIDMVYSKTMMVSEREVLYNIVEHIQANSELVALFTQYSHDSIIAARLRRMTSPAACHLTQLIAEYGTRYGWFYSRDFRHGLCPVGMIPLEDCINRLRRYLHVDMQKYRANIDDIAANANRLRELGRNKCLTPEDIVLFDTALKAGEKAFLAGDDHAYYICSRKQVYACDALLKAADALVKSYAINTPQDICYLYMSEILELLARGGSAQPLVSTRREQHVLHSRAMPPKSIGASCTEESDKEENVSEGRTVQPIVGEAGIKKTVRGRVYIGFPKHPPEYDAVLLLEHGHEGDLTTILSQVKGLILKMGTPACHMGIIARELNIPAIYGVGAKADALKTGDLVEIRGETGEVVLLESSQCLEREASYQTTFSAT